MGMERSGVITVWLVVVALVMVVDGIYSQTDCNTQIAALSPCLSFVEGQTDQASAACCSALNTVHTSSPGCLCSLIASKTPIPGVNLTQAERLPALCNIPDADPSKCAAILGGPPSSSPSAPGPSGSPKSGGGSSAPPHSRASSVMLGSPLNFLGVALITCLELLPSYSLKFWTN